MSDKPKCAYCGANGDTELHRDHVVPRSRGGPDNAFNIVMACQPCNSAKRDATASEWLGERCPDVVRQIEDRVNAKLKLDFQKRDYKPRKPHREEPADELFAFNIRPDGAVAYIGQVMEERGGFLRVEVIDGVMSHCGLWQLSGHIHDLPRSECRLFNDKQVCWETGMRINERFFAEAGK